MKRLLSRLAPPLLATAVLAAGCSSLSGPRKVVINQTVCGNIHFLNMKLNETNRVVLDNKSYSSDQTGMSVTLNKFPVIVKGEVPPNSIIAEKLSTIRLHADPGQQQTVDLVPQFTGTFSGTCAVSIKQGESGSQIRSTDIQFQIK